MRQRIRIASPAICNGIRNDADAKMKVPTGLGRSAAIAKQFTPLHTLSCVHDEFLKVCVEGFTPWVVDADKAAISFGIIADCRDDTIVRGDDSSVWVHFKINAIVPKQRCAAHDTAPVVLRAGAPFLDDAPLAFKWRCQVDPFRLVESVFDWAMYKIKRHQLRVGRMSRRAIRYSDSTTVL